MTALVIIPACRTCMTTMAISWSRNADGDRMYRAECPTCGDVAQVPFRVLDSNASHAPSHPSETPYDSLGASVAPSAFRRIG